MDLDELYGPCLTPAKNVAWIEQHHESQSLTILDSGTAPALKAYLESTQQMNLASVMHMTTPILWLMDEDGQIRFGLEEVFNVDSGKITFVLPRNSPPLRAGEARLGHPALLEPGPTESKLARIGGEIIYDPDLGAEQSWVLTNNSGRYGKRPHIEERNLENVQKQFAEFGISLTRYFYYTPGDVGAAK